MPTEDLMHAVREFQAALKSSSSYGQAVTEVRKVLKRVRPSSRAATIREIVEKLALNDVFMNYLYDLKRGSKLTYENTRDLLGEPLADWKDSNEIDEYDPAWEDMSSDTNLVKGLSAKLLQWAPKDVVAPLDYSEAAMEARWVLDALDNLQKGQSYNEAADLEKARQGAAKILKILKG
jgi:hypothetical protein